MSTQNQSQPRGSHDSHEHSRQGQGSGKQDAPKKMHSNDSETRREGARELGSQSHKNDNR